MHGHNKAFASDPAAYLRKIAVNHLSMKVYGQKDQFDFPDARRFTPEGRPLPGAYAAYLAQVDQAIRTIIAAKVASFDLEPCGLQGRHVAYLRFVVPGRFAPTLDEYGGLPRGADPPFKAYWLGYLQASLQGLGKDRIPFVDLPKLAPAHRFVLTGAMNGCSLVVTEHPTDPLKLRVYHDSVHGADTFRDDVVYARIDYTAGQPHASANRRAALLQGTPRADLPARPALKRALSSTGPDHVPPPLTRSRSLGAPGVDSAPEAASCVHLAYGNGAPGAALRTSFNLLYFDAAGAQWMAVSQALDVQPSTAQPVKSFFERQSAFEARQKAHQRMGVQVLMPAGSPVQCVPIPY